MFDLSSYISFSIHGGGDSGGVAGSVARFLAFVESLLQQSPEQVLTSILPGIAAMPNVHPLLVHFPIALLTTFWVFDLLGTWLKHDDWRRAASWFLYFGTVTAIFTVAAGFVAADSVPHSDEVHHFMEEHEHLGVTILAVALVLSVWRLLARTMIREAANVLHLLMTAIMIGLLFFAADLGGLMVYRYGVAVQAVPPPADGATLQHAHGH